MSILIKSIENSNIRGRNVILFADLKSEVPSTGQETVALLNEKTKLNAGDVIYTAALEAAILDSNDEWDWSFGGGSGGVTSVNGKTGNVVLTSHDIGAADAPVEVTISTNGAVAQALDAGSLYHFTGVLTALTITFNVTATGQLAQYHFDFTEGSTAFDPVLPNKVVLPDNHTWAADTHYEVDILNNYACVVGWSVS